MSVSGPNAGIESVRLNGRRLSANLTNSIVGDPTIRRTIEGASELSIAVSDPDGKLRRETFLDEAARLIVDDLRFSLVKVSKSGDTLTLTGEDELIYLLRQKTGPKKAFRDKVTRAQFVRTLVKEALGKRVRFYSPELTITQPIGRGDDTTEEDEPAPGIPRNAKGLTVKGAPATLTQKKVADRVIRLALKYNPPRRALLALLSAAIVESVMGTRGMTSSVDLDSLGLLQGRQIYNRREDLLDFDYNIRRFFFRPWTGISEGAIEQAKRGVPPGEIAWTIQGPREDLRGRYAEYVGEANRWIDAYFGGEAGDFGGGETVERYAFEVKKNEDYWTAIKRLADEVNWRAFVVGRTFYFASEKTLLTGRRRALLNEDARGVDLVDWEIDAGKKAESATVTARIGGWDAPPGTVAVLDESHGPARGSWLIAEIDGNLTNEDVTISLKRATKPKPEPAPERTETSGGGSSSASGGAEKMIRWAEATVGTTEGSARQRKWAAFAGMSYTTAWCAIYIGYGLKKTVGLDPPPGFAYTGNWLSWSGGKRVSGKNLRPGDLIIYDWGDGGITDHISLYIGNGQSIGGNEAGQRVNKGDARLSSAVGYVRPRYPGGRT